MSLFNTGYKHWEGKHLGIWHRRWVIAENGLNACLQSKWARILIVTAWLGCLLQIAVLFLIGQLLVQDSIIYVAVGQLSGPAKQFVTGFVNWIVSHPEISVRTTFNVLFYYFSKSLLVPAFLVITLVVPHLITRDLSSRAIIVYSSKAISRFDYFLGKFGTIFGMLTLTWLAPLATAWFVGNLMTSDWHFFWHSRVAIFNTVIFLLSAMTILSVLVLGISALSSKGLMTGFLWMMYWLLGLPMVVLGMLTDKPWLQNLSINYNLHQLALAIFNPAAELKLAQDNVPVLGQLLAEAERNQFQPFQTAELQGALIGLGVVVALAIVILNRRIRPE